MKRQLTVDGKILINSNAECAMEFQLTDAPIQVLTEILVWAYLYKYKITRFILKLVKIFKLSERIESRRNKET